MPRCTLPVSCQTADLSTRPPSSGSPGTRLSAPTSRLPKASPSTTISSSPSGTTNQSPSATTPTASEVSGPTTAIQNSWRGFFASASIAVTPPRKCSVIEDTGKP